MLKIITPPATSDLTTINVVKRDLDISTSRDDAYLCGLIQSCSWAAETFCRRSFGLTVYQETFRRKYSGGCSMNGQTNLVLSRFPLVSISSIVEDDGPALTEGVDFDADSDGVVARLCNDRVRDWNSAKIVVEYSAGYLLPNDSGRTLPVDIERAVLLTVKAAYFSRTRDPLLKSQDVHGLEATSFGAVGLGPHNDLLPEAESLLTPYRLPVI